MCLINDRMPGLRAACPRHTGAPIVRAPEPGWVLWLPKKVTQCQPSEYLLIIGRQNNGGRCEVHTACYSSIRAANARRYRPYDTWRTRAGPPAYAHTLQFVRIRIESAIVGGNRLANFKGSPIIPVDWAGVGSRQVQCKLVSVPPTRLCINTSQNMWQVFAGTSTDSGAAFCCGPATSPIQRFAHPIWPRVRTGSPTQTSWRQSARRLAC